MQSEIVYCGLDKGVDLGSGPGVPGTRLRDRVREPPLKQQSHPRPHSHGRDRGRCHLRSAAAAASTPTAAAAATTSGTMYRPGESVHE